MKNIFFRRGPVPVNIFRFMIYLPKFIKLYWRLFKDTRVPIHLKFILAGAVLYFISPIDILPEILNPLIGLSDDIAILALTFKYFIKKAPQDVVEEHVKQLSAEKG